MKKLASGLGLIALISLSDGLIQRAAAQAPTVSKSILLASGDDCTDPCTQDINAAPAISTVTYTITIENNDTRNPVVVDVSDDIPPNALAYRVVDKGNFQPCPGVSGPSCQLLQAPGGANGTGQVNIKALTIGRVGSPFPAATIKIEVDFACSPPNDNDIISNQAKVFTPNVPSLCNPCLTNTKQFTVNCLPPAPYEFTKTVSPLTWKPGDSQTLTYTIVIKNKSATQTVQGSTLEVRDFLPRTGGFSPIPQLLTPPTCPITVTSSPMMPLVVNNMDCDDQQLPKDGDPTIRITGFSDIPPNGQVTLTFTGSVRDDLGAGSNVCNKAQVFRSGIEGLYSRACTTIEDIPMNVDFDQSSKSVSADPIPSGSPFSYTIAVNNSGTGTATNVVLTDILPDCADASGFNAATDVVISPPGGSASYNAGTRTLTVNLGTIGSTATKMVTINGLFAGAENPTCCNQASVVSTEVTVPTDIGRAPGSSFPVCFGIDPAAAPAFTQSTKAVAPSPVPSGDPLVYTLTITNTGTGAATNVSVKDPFPTCVNDSGFNQNTDVAVTGGPFTTQYNARTLNVNLGDMAVNETRTITITGLVAGGATSNCCNQATIQSNEAPIPVSTGTVPGGGDPTCMTITSIPPTGCDLLRQVVTSKGADPWVYTTVCSPTDSRLAGPPFATNIPKELDIEPVGSASSADLTLYDLACSCADVISLYKNRTVSPVMVHAHRP